MIKRIAVAAFLFLAANAANAVTVGNDLVATDSGNCLFQNGCPQSLGLLPHIGAENFNVGASGASVTGLDFTSWVGPSAPNLASVGWYIYQDARGLPGTTLASGQASVLQNVILGPAPCCQSTLMKTSFNIPGVSLTAGGYWVGFILNLVGNPIGQYYYWANTQQGDGLDAMYNGTVWSIGPGDGIRGLTDHNRAFHVTLDSPSAVPIPAALPLFATGLGALGLLGWWRKRRSVAA